MDEIPEDLMAAAESAIADNCTCGRCLPETVARAILAERERCANVAGGYYDNSALLERRPGPTMQEGIAAAIRKGEA